MSSSSENRLSYASSPESDLEVSPPPAPRLVKSSSDPSIATTQDNMDRDDDINLMAEAVPPPYSQGGYDSKYGFANGNSNGTQSLPTEAPPYQMQSSPPNSPLYGTVPELPPRGPPPGGTPSRPTGGVLLPAPPPTRHGLRHTNNPRPSAQERLFGSKETDDTYSARPQQGSLDRHRHTNNPQGSYDGTYDYSTNAHNPSRLPPNAPDDLKVAPTIKMEPQPSANPTNMATQSPQRNSNSHEHNSLDYNRTPENNYRPDNYRTPQVRPPMNGNSPHAQNAHNAHNNHNAHNAQVQNAHNPHNAHNAHNSQIVNTPMHARGPSLPNVPTNDHAKYSARTNSASQADYGGRAPPYKPVPPPKPKHYRPPEQPLQQQHPQQHSQQHQQQHPQQIPQHLPPHPRNGSMDVSVPGTHYSHSHSHSQPHRAPHGHGYHQ
ncbi:tight junction protein, partial [Danaus plexippus plexippus]